MAIQDPTEIKDGPSADSEVELLPIAVPKRWGPQNPHPLSLMRTEVVWDGKYDEYGNRREFDAASLTMPLQKIETVDEPATRYKQLGLFDQTKAHRDDFRNSLIWGDNKLVIASLLREYKNSVQLIYIDPPFDVGADFTMDIPIGDGTEVAHKDQSVLEMVAYRDTWGKGTDSYLHMIYERLVLMRELLSENGSIYVHVGPTVSHYVRAIMDEVFGRNNFVNEIIWRRAFSHNDPGRCGNIHDSIFYYSKTDKRIWNKTFQEPSQDYIDAFFDQYCPERKEKYNRLPLDAPRHGDGGNLLYEWKGVWPSAGRTWAYLKEQMEEFDRDGRIHYPKKKGGKPRLKSYLSDYEGSPLQDLWTDISKIHNRAAEQTGYATQKPEALIERIIKSSSNEGDLVADFFCGSGTTCAVAERLNRRWIAADLGRFAIHTTRKRLLDVQRELYAESKLYRRFDLYNLGRYERQWWQREKLNGADEEHRKVLLAFYKAEALSQSASPMLHGRKGKAFIYVDNIDSLLTRNELAEAVNACVQANGKELHCLSWEFEMDLKTIATALEHQHGIRIKLIPVPREVMERNRLQPPPFLEMAEVEVEPIIRKKGSETTVDIKLKRFVPSLAEIPVAELDGLKERAVKSGFDFIDFWSVDFEFTPGGAYNHQWQAYRTKQKRTLELQSTESHKYANKGKHLICVKVIDVFGADTTVTVEVTT